MHNHLVEPGVEGQKVTSHSTLLQVQALSLEAPTFVECSFFVFDLQFSTSKHWRLNIIFLLSPSMSFRAQSLKAPRKAETNIFVFNFQLSMLKVGDQAQSFLPWPFVQLLSLELDNFKRGLKQIFLFQPNSKKSFKTI
jgi:hypothetical protein